MLYCLFIGFYQLIRIPCENDATVGIIERSSLTWRFCAVTFDLPERPSGKYLLNRKMLSPRTLFPFVLSEDGESHPGAADPSAGAGEGERPVQGLLQSLHRLPQD